MKKYIVELTSEEPVGCEDDTPTSFVVAHSRGVFGPPDTGLRYMKLLR